MLGMRMLLLHEPRLKFKEDPIPSSVNGGINPDPKLFRS